MSAIHQLLREQFEIEDELPALREEAKKLASRARQAGEASSAAAYRVHTKELQLAAGETILLQLSEREGWHVSVLNQLRKEMREHWNEQKK